MAGEQKAECIIIFRSWSLDADFSYGLSGNWPILYFINMYFKKLIKKCFNNMDIRNFYLALSNKKIAGHCVLCTICILSIISCYSAHLKVLSVPFSKLGNWSSIRQVTCQKSFNWEFIELGLEIFGCLVPSLMIFLLLLLDT